MSIYNGPPRPGARGGRDQYRTFSWDNVKSDKDREFYLGHSVKALAGRWQKNKDVYWYTREKEAGESSLADEIRAVKAREEDAMLEALGFKPKAVKPLAPAELNQAEMAALLKRGRSGEVEPAQAGQQTLGVPGVDAGEKVAGLGFSAKAAAAAGPAADQQGMELGGTMAGVGIPSDSQGPAGVSAKPAAAGTAALPGPPPLTTPAAMLAMAKAGVKLSSAQMKLLSSSERKAAKKARKEAKKAKKAAKKASKKSKHKRKHSSSSSSSSSSGSDKEDERPHKSHKVGELPPQSNRDKADDFQQQRRDRAHHQPYDHGDGSRGGGGRHRQSPSLDGVRHGDRSHGHNDRDLELGRKWEDSRQRERDGGAPRHGDSVRERDSGRGREQRHHEDAPGPARSQREEDRGQETGRRKRHDSLDESPVRASRHDHERVHKSRSRSRGREGHRDADGHGAAARHRSAHGPDASRYARSGDRHESRSRSPLRRPRHGASASPRPARSRHDTP